MIVGDPYILDDGSICIDVIAGDERTSIIIEGMEIQIIQKLSNGFKSRQFNFTPKGKFSEFLGSGQPILQECPREILDNGDILINTSKEPKT